MILLASLNIKSLNSFWQHWSNGMEVKIYCESKHSNKEILSLQRHSYGLFLFWNVSIFASVKDPSVRSELSNDA